MAPWTIATQFRRSLLWGQPPLMVTASLSLTKEREKRHVSEVPDKPGAVAIPPTDAVLTIVGMNRTHSPMSQGSGFILTPDGIAGTNYHAYKLQHPGLSLNAAAAQKFAIGSIEGADLDKDLVIFQLYELGTTQKPTNLPHFSIASRKDVSDWRQGDCNWQPGRVG